MTKGNDIEDRLIDFAVRIINVSDELKLSKSSARHIQNQLVRSGTSPAPNYGEARGAESTRDFIHKLKVVLKELNETQVWLKIIIKAEMVKATLLKDLLDENQQLSRIINASIVTAKKNLDAEPS